MRSEFELLADMPPAIVQSEPRYQQATEPGLRLFGVSSEPERKMPIWNLDGIEWFEADPPPRFHEHWAQTVGRLDLRSTIYRCPCGAHGGPWESWLLLGQRRTRGWFKRRVVNNAPSVV